MFGYHARIFLAMANTDIRSSGGDGCNKGRVYYWAKTKSYQIPPITQRRGMLNAQW